MKTHRCNRSLEEEVSIRYCKRWENFDVPNDYEAWRLFKYDTYDNCLRYVTEIEYCCYCGKPLFEEEFDE